MTDYEFLNTTLKKYGHKIKCYYAWDGYSEASYESIDDETTYTEYSFINGMLDEIRPMRLDMIF